MPHKDREARLAYLREYRKRDDVRRKEKARVGTRNEYFRKYSYERRDRFVEQLRQNIARNDRANEIDQRRLDACAQTEA